MTLGALGGCHELWGVIDCVFLTPGFLLPPTYFIYDQVSLVDSDLADVPILMLCISRLYSSCSKTPTPGLLAMTCYVQWH